MTDDLVGRLTAEAYVKARWADTLAEAVEAEGLSEHALAQTAVKHTAAYFAARIEALEAALRRIAEGNLGDLPWQANYERIRQVTRAALTPEAPHAD